MLVITRKSNESIIINGNIEVVVVAITKDGVRLGINAPKEVQVHRQEVYEAIVEANRAAAAASRPAPVQDAAALLRGRSPQVKLTKGR